MRMTKREIALFFIIWFASTLSFLYITGVMFNGFFWGDHQQYLLIYDDMQHNSVLKAIWNALKKDLMWRWRPLFILQYGGGAY